MTTRDWVNVALPVLALVALALAYLLGYRMGRGRSYHDGYSDGWQTADQTWVADVVDGQPRRAACDDDETAVMGINVRALPNPMVPRRYRRPTTEE